MKKTKKLTALILSFAIIISAVCLPVSANTDVTERGMQILYTVLDKAVDGLVNAITAMIIGPRWQNIKDYKSENFYKGLSKDEFLDEPADNNQWSLGYANASIRDGNELDGKHFVGGSLSVSDKVVTEVRDDQEVRTVAISDGRGITIFSTIDAFGLTNKAVREIRSRLANSDYVKNNKINLTSVNVSVLHQHSCVDTFGMNGSIINALFTAQFKNLFGIKADSGINEEFQEHLYKTIVESMINAIKNMETGELYYGSVNVKEYIRDKRDPQVFDPELHRLRFVPENEDSKQTWVVEGGIHCVGLGAAGTIVSGDYPYYMEQYINKNNNANFMYIEGAELAISDQYATIDPDPEISEKYNDEGYGEVATYGYTLAQKLGTIEDEEKLEPILNIAHKEITVKVSNAIFKFAAKFGLLTNEVVRDGLSLKVISELGYVEFGKTLAIAIMPGELAPEIAFGGAMTADDPLNWTKEDWNYPSFASETDRDLIVFGLMNDQIGYILTDNSWHSIFTENEEIVATGNVAGSTIAESYFELIKDVA